MTHLARQLRLIDYFALGFGTMVGTGWLVVMDNILHRGGPLGAILGFTAGALMLLPIGHVYGRLVKRIPDAAGEVAYTARVFPSAISFVTGWMMFLAYLLTCPFEALAAGRFVSGVEYDRALSLGRLYSLSAARGAGVGHQHFLHLAQLLWDSGQHQVPEVHDLYVSDSGDRVCASRPTTWKGSEFPAGLQSYTAVVHPAGMAGSAMADVWLRIRGQELGRGQPRFSAWQLLGGNPHDHLRRGRILLDRYLVGGLCCAMAGLEQQPAISDRAGR